MTSRARFERLTRAALTAMRKLDATDDEVFLTSLSMAAECIAEDEDPEERDGMAKVAIRFFIDDVMQDNEDAPSAA